MIAIKLCAGNVTDRKRENKTAKITIGSKFLGLLPFIYNICYLISAKLFRLIKIKILE